MKTLAVAILLLYAMACYAAYLWGYSDGQQKQQKIPGNIVQQKGGDK